MDRGWAQFVADVLGAYTYNGNEAARMIRRLKEKNTFALAMALWSEGDGKNAEIVLETALVEMGYEKHSERTGK